MATRARLTSTAVVQAAAELLNEEGPGALSLNRLAEKLEVRTPSLYNHVDRPLFFTHQIFIRHLLFAG